jgi:PEP-CTERM motif
VKPVLSISLLMLCLAAGAARASETFTITKTPDITLTGASATTEEVWNFTALPGWSQDLDILSVEITETFSNVSDGAQFASTFIQYTPTLADLPTQPRIYVIFPVQTPTSSETVTENAPYPCCTDSFSETFSTADITGDGTLGVFDTRVSRNAGSFEIDTLTISITAAPEPATVAVMGLGLGLIALCGFKRRRA